MGLTATRRFLRMPSDGSERSPEYYALSFRYSQGSLPIYPQNFFSRFLALTYFEFTLKTLGDRIPATFQEGLFDAGLPRNDCSP